MREAFLKLVRLGIEASNDTSLSKDIDWLKLLDLAERQGLLGVALDGIDKLPIEQRPKKQDMLQWIGVSLQQESQYAIQEKAAGDMALIFKNNAIRTYVLKGAVVAECYPNPVHRSSSDLDCFLVKDVSGSKIQDSGDDWDAWSLGNDLIKANGFEVEDVFYKNSTFFLPGLMVENHRFLTPFRGNKKLKALERVLQAMMYNDTGEDKFEGVWLYRPPVMVTALFLIEHAYSHFLHEGLTWRHILDWMMFSRKHESEIDWNELSVFVDEFGFRKFYEAFLKMGEYLLGELSYEDLNHKENKMLADIWAPLDLHETARGVKGKLALAGNTWRARWKYRYFGDITMLHALWIQAKGVLFEKKPILD